MEHEPSDVEAALLPEEAAPEKATTTGEDAPSSSRDDNVEGKYSKWRNRKYKLPGHYRLATEENSRKYSMYAVNFLIIASSVNTKMLNPNFAIMCSPGASDDSFPNTEPFGFNSATYFLPLTTLIGVALSSTMIGGWSDRVGRKRVMLTLAWISAAGSIVKYFTRGSFWAFCASNFAFGFFLGNLPVGMAYVGDVETNKKRKDEMLGVLVGCFVMGNSGGGIIAVLMNDAGLFSALWVGTGLMVLAACVGHTYMIEPGDSRLNQGATKELSFDNDDDETEKRPEVIDNKTLWIIVGGALLDNIGSTGLFPLCLSPLALEQYYGDFVAVGKEPIMSVNAYQWLSVCVALLVVPSTQMTPFVFNKIGVAGTCVFGNVCTAVVTLALLLIGNASATNLAFGMFVFVMYGGFPFTVFSQLTTGPMLDVIAPEDKIGYVQGLNNSAMNFGMALAPWAFGLLADVTSTNTAIITGIGFSIVAAIANSRLMFHKKMGRQIPKPPIAKRRLDGEDEEIIQKLLDGDYVDPEIIFEINRERGARHKSFIVPRVKPYEEDKENLFELAKNARATFKFRQDIHDRILSEWSTSNSNPEDALYTKEEMCEILNSTIGGDQPVVSQARSDLGQWIGDYLEDNGYHPHTASTLIKQMVIASFPTLLKEKEYTPENIEEYLLRGRKVMAKYVEMEEENKFSITNVLGKSAVVFYS